MIDRTSVRVALRTLGRHRVFTITAVASLAIAIALNTTMYSVLDAMFAPHIDAAKVENLYQLTYYGDYHQKLPPGTIERSLSVQMRGFEAVTGVWLHSQLGVNPVAANGASFRHVRVARARSNLFDVLGTPATQGRTFLPRDAAEGNAIVISDWLAGQLFPDASAIGRTLTVADQPYVVIGVVPRNQRFLPLSFDVYMIWPGAPISLVRFRDHVDVRVAYAELGVIAAQLALAAGEEISATRFHLKDFGEVRQFVFYSFHWALIGAVLAVLLVACANLANLQLARGLARTRELALRSAVGASRRQLIQHLLLESSILAAAGLVVGVVLTLWSVSIVRATIPPVMNRFMIDPQASWRMFAFAAAAAVVCVFLVGLLPALHVSRVDPDALLKSSAGTGANRANRRRYGMMVVAQIALALPVLIGALLVVRSAVQWRDPNYVSTRLLGFDPTPIVSARVTIAGTKGSRVSTGKIAADFTAHARSVPGVLDATLLTFQSPDSQQVTVYDANGDLVQVPAFQWTYHVVTPSYSRTFGRTMKAGRDFIDGESDGASVIIDEPTSKFLFKDASAVGRSIKFGHAQSREPWLRIVGIVNDLRDSATLAQNYRYGRTLMNVYRVIGPRDSIAVTKRRGTQAYSDRAILVYARVQGNTDLAAQRIERELRSISPPTMPPSVVPFVEEWYLGGARRQQEFVGSLFSVFAVIGVGLVAIGMFGIVAHSVVERTREIAVRISLGATTSDVLRAVLREGNALLLSGLAVGLFLAMFGVPFLGGFMNWDDTTNSFLYAAIGAALFVIAAAAAFIPALRATRIDPVEALRHE